MIKEKSAPLFMALLAAAFAAAGQELPSLSSLIDAGTLARIRTEGKAVVTASGEAASNLAIPLGHPGMDLIRKGIKAEKPGMLVEALFLLERPVASPAPADPSPELTKISQILTSLSSLQGIEYWSESRKAWRTFYAESWRIDDATARNRLPDAPRRIGAEGLTLYAWQKDLSFGGNVYRYDYALAGGRDAPPALLVTQTNLTRMSYGLIPLVGAEGLETRILVIQAKEGILFYAASAANSPPIPILSGKLQDSFSNRAAALFKWFGARMAAGG